MLKYKGIIEEILGSITEVLAVKTFCRRMPLSSYNEVEVKFFLA